MNGHYRHAFLVATILLVVALTYACYKYVVAGGPAFTNSRDTGNASVSRSERQATTQKQDRLSETDSAERQTAPEEHVDENRGKTRDATAHDPPMIEAEVSDLEGDEPVIGVSLNDDPRAYPLTMLFGGGGIFELLNDSCGGQPIAASW